MTELKTELIEQVLRSKAPKSVKETILFLLKEVLDDRHAIPYIDTSFKDSIIFTLVNIDNVMQLIVTADDKDGDVLSYSYKEINRYGYLSYTNWERIFQQIVDSSRKYIKK